MPRPAPGALLMALMAIEIETHRASSRFHTATAKSASVGCAVVGEFVDAAMPTNDTTAASARVSGLSGNLPICTSRPIAHFKLTIPFPQFVVPADRWRQEEISDVE
jgi:hypothetical protein